MSDPSCNIGYVADADILRDLREQVLDESQSLPGLLRKCLALGAITGSDQLRAWATNELKGYPTDVPLPPYRELVAPMFIDRRGGVEYARGMQINHLHIPSDLRQYVPETVDFRQSVDELAALANSTETAHTMSYSIFSLVTGRWSRKLPMYQEITALYYKVAPESIGGIVGAIRTTLVAMVVDMSRSLPLDSLPTGAKVNEVVQVHIGSGDRYEVNIGGSNSGNIGQGSNFSQVQNTSVPTELVELLTRLRAGLDEVKNVDDRAEAEQAIEDFEESVSEDNPKPEKIKRRWAILERVVTALGVAGLSEAVKQGAPVLIDHLQLMM